MPSQAGPRKTEGIEMQRIITHLGQLAPRKEKERAEPSTLSEFFPHSSQINKLPSFVGKSE